MNIETTSAEYDDDFYYGSAKRDTHGLNIRDIAYAIVAGDQAEIERQLLRVLEGGEAHIFECAIAGARRRAA